MDISSMRRSDRISPDVPLGELLGDVAGHAQGVIRTEVQLGFAQARHELNGAMRRITLQLSASAFAVIGAIALMIAGAMALSRVVAPWLAVLMTGGVALLVALTLFGLAGRERT